MSPLCNSRFDFRLVRGAHIMHADSWLMNRIEIVGPYDQRELTFGMRSACINPPQARPGVKKDAKLGPATHQVKSFQECYLEPAI
jgi:hypothetical protein